MRKFSFIERLIAVCCILAIMLSFPWTPVLAAAETDVRVTASTNTSVKQGNSAYTYVYIDSMESLSTLEVTVHYDPAVVQLTGSYNQVDALVYDSGSTESTLQYTYIFDGNGQNAKTQLFYFEYIVKKDAPVGQSYFDIVVGDAFDAAFNTLPVSGSRCSFRVAEAVTDLQCSLWGTSSVETAVNQEFTLTYRFSTTEIASGSVAIRFDPELFAVSEVIQGGFLTDKMTDINTTLSGAVYLSFLGAQYGSSDQLLSLRMKTLKNTSQLSPITVTVTDLYNLQLDPITCDGYTTPVRVNYDPTVDENAPYVFLKQTYDPEAQTVKVQVCLEENARLGAGDFVLQFDTQRLAYKSAVKGYNSTFFTINDKNTDEGLLKFSVISLTDITTAEILLTATFDVLTPCESTATKLQISGSGLSDHLTVPIVLNFTGCTVETAGHTTAVDAAVAPTCLETGLTEGSHCAVCQEVLVAQEPVAALGHDEIPHEAKAPTCTEIGWEAYNTCSRCDYTTYVEIPANGHTFQKGVCVICGADQDPGKTWDVSAAADGSLMAKLYLNADGTYDLQLTGSGPMKNWSSSSSVPWYSYRERITGLRLPDGLTTIGDYAFNSFTALTEITLPESLESLGYMAFYQCTKLQQINFNAVAMNDLTEGNHVFSFCGQETNGITLRIGADVEKIPAYLFLPDTRDSYRPKLTAVEFEAGGNCLEIGQMAFYQCKDISRLQLPEGLQSIGYYAFAYCAGLESLTLPEGLMTIENYAFYACDALQEVELPGSLTQIGYCAFTGCSGLKKVTVLEGVTIIGDHAFYNCNGLQQLQLPASLTTIGSAAFAACTGLRKLRLPETVTTIGVSAFNGCTGLDELQLPKNLVTIGSNAFVGCAGLTELHLPEGLQTIDYAAFSGCTGLTELTLPKSLRSIGGSAFDNCRGLTKINFNAANLADLADSNWVFAYAGQNGDGITVSVGSGVTKIPAYLFYPYSSSGYAPKIVAVEFAESSACQSIGQYAFYGCTDLRSLTLPESLQTIGNYAFYNCRSLIKINFNAVELADLKNGNAAFSYAGQSGDGITLTVGSSVTQIPAYLFCPLYSNPSYTPKVTAVTFEEGSSCRRIGTYAFYQSEQLTKICIPESVEEIGVNAFAYCANLVIALEADTLPATLGNNWKGSSPYILGVDRMILEADACYALLKNGSAVLIRYYGSEETYSIPDIVENAPVVGIHEKAFYGNTQLKAVQWPEGLQTIGASAFSGCTGLTELTLPESLQTIGSSAFYGCTGLETLTLPESLQTVGNSAFSGCTALTEIRLNAVQMTDLAYNNGVFYNAGKAGEGITLTVGKQVTRIPAYLCYPSTGADYTPKITRVVFEEESVCQSIGRTAFAHNLSLQEAQIPATVNRIEDTAFGYCKNLILTFESDTLPETLGSGWATNVTYYLGAPRVVTVGDARYTIVGEAYAILSRYNGKGETFRVEDQVEGIPVTVIDKEVFRGNTKLTAVTLPESLQHIGASAFYGCTGLSQLHLPESLQTIGSNAFQGCTGLESLTLPENLQTIGKYAFSHCKSLTKINYNAVNLADLSNNNRIFSYAGQNGDGITVSVGSSVTKIPAYLFYPYSNSDYAPKIVAVEFAEGSNCQSIGNRAFYGCTGLTELTLPESLQTIGGSAFYGCTGLRKVMVLSSAVAEQLTSADAAGYLTQYAQTVLLPGDTTINSYLQNKYANREQIIRDGVSYWLLDQNTHSWLETQTLIERIPCQRDGLIRYTCEHCEIYKDVTVERHTIVGHEAKAPDCVHIGWHAYETCENCDYSTYAEIPALGHDPVAHEAKAQTCLAIGWEAYETCSRCDYSTYQELPALGHDEIPHAAQAVTCLEIGWDAYVTCSHCDYSTYQEIPALGHGIIKHDALAPTCLEIGWDAYETCSRCDYSTYAELSALGHRVLQRTTSGPAPYEEKNDATWPFSREEDIFASSNHDHGTTSHYVITAKQDHTLTVECKVSSENNYDFLWVYHNGSLIAALAGEADWQAYTLEVKTGDTVKISYMKDGSQSKGQDTGWFRLKASWLEQLPGEEAEPTCVEPVVCAFCDTKLKDALGHDPVYSHTQQPTCLEVGYHVYACTRCAYTEKQEIAALGHDPVYSHTQQPTCLEVGYHVYACTRCDYIEKQEIAALGHDLVSYEAKAPTCTEIGWDAYEACSRCSYTTYKEIPATGHSFVETFCTGCGMKQTPMQSWDVSAAGDGSLMAYLYQNLVDGGYELELEGSGTMKDYSYNAPWYSAGYCYSINRISLPEGLTYIGACAFQYCSDLRQIRIPDSVERIDNSAFNYAKNLVVIFEGDDASLAPSYGWYGCGYYFDPQKVILDADATYVIDKDGNAVLAKYVGNGNEFVAREEIDGIPVTQIGRYAFYQKTNLKTYWISEEINTIGDYAFGECNGTALLLESTQLPTSLGSGWNGNCDYYPGAQLFTENDFLFVKDQNDRVNLITYQGTESEITVPAQPGGYSITRIPNYAFYENRMLTRVVLPEGIVSVGDSAFASCGRLQEVVLPTSLEKIGSSAFQYCGALQSIRLPEGLQTIGTGAFWGCGSLTEISIPDSVTRLESTTFTDCSQLESVTLPKNLNYMGYMQFYGCPNLKELELPEGVHAVGSNSFYRCENLKVVYVRSSQLAAQLTGSGDAHEMIQNATTVVVPAGTGTDYLKATYPYCETRMRHGVSVDVYSSCAHNWQTEKVSEYAQCVSDGYEIHTCSLCGVWTDDRIPMHAMETTVFAPACTEDGYTLHTCADCGWAERTDPVNKLGHERDYGGVLCNRCGEVACLLALKNGDSLFGCGSWQEAMNEAWRGNTLVLYGDITGDVRLYQTMRLDLNGHDIHGTLIVSVGATLYGVDSATDDFTGSYGSIAAINGNFLKDATSVDGKRYIALTDEKGVSFHRLQLQLHTVTLRTAKAGLYYKASLKCDEALRNAITRHGVALSLERMPGADFKENSLYTWIDGAPAGDFTSGSVCNIFRSDLSPEENAARGAMKIYTNAYLQLADGTILMSDATTGDTVDSYRFDGVAWSMQDVLEVLNRDIDAPAYVECRQQILSFCEAWKDILSGWQLNNLTQ